MAAKSVKKEVLQPMIYSSGTNTLDAINPDLILENTRSGYELYEIMEIDNAITKNLNLAKAYPNKYAFKVDQNESSEAVYEFIKKKFDQNSHENIDLQTVFNAGANCIYYGFSVLQTLYNGSELQNLIDFKAKYFQFKTNGDLYSPYYSQGEILETLKGDKYSFIVMRTNMTDNNYYGTGIAQAIYYLREVKKEIVKAKQISLGKYGVTPYLATMEFDASQKKEYDIAKTGFATTMESLRSGGFGVVNGKSINIIPLLNTLSINDLIAAEKEIDIMITGLMSGATDSLESQSSGSQARATVQDEVVKIIQEHYLKIIQKAINQLIRSMVDIAFPKGQKYPFFKFQTQKEPQFADLTKAIDLKIDVDRELFNPYIGANPDPEKSTLALVQKYATPEPNQTAQFAEIIKKKSLNLKI